MQEKPYGLAVKAIIDDGDGRILMLRRSGSSRLFAGTWEPPGGKVDAGEPYDAALLREVREETGLAIRLDTVAGASHYEMPELRLAVLFMNARLVSGQVRLSDEHDEFRWVPLPDLPQLDMSGQLRDFIVTYVKSAVS